MIALGKPSDLALASVLLTCIGFNFRILVQVGAIVVVFSILPFGTHQVFDEFLAWKYALLA